METSELLKKVRAIEIKTKGLSSNIFAGAYQSAFKGRGMAFSEVREYQPGDEVRTIDWKVTARFNHPYIKIFEEERELTLMLIIDVSASENYGGGTELKKERITEIAAVLAFSAIQNNDKIGVILFSDRVEKYIAPKKGRSHVLTIIRELLNFEPQHKGTNISEAVGFFANVIKRRSTAFLISDFMDQNFEDALRSARNKHDLIGLRIVDPLEQELPSVGLIRIQDAETGQERYIDSSNKSVRKQYQQLRRQQSVDLRNTFMKIGIDYTEIRMDQSYINPLMMTLKNR
jgi:uncharacterized protein (DUF58 family)